MQNSVLFQTLGTLTPLERKHLGQWLRSEFFNRRTEPVQLFEYLCECLDARREPDRDTVQARLFGGENARPYRRKVVAPDEAPAATEQAIRLVMSELLGQVEHFLVYRESFAETANFGIRLAAAYRRRGLDKHFNQSLQTARTAWNRQPHRHTEYFDAQVAIEYERYQHLSAGRRTEALNLQELSDHTDTAYIARKLQQACFALTHQAVYRADYDFGLLPSVLSHVGASERLLGIPAVGLYYYCYHFLSNPDEEAHFSTFKLALFTHTHQLPTEEQRNLHLLAINYCIKKINQLRTLYFREALDLYQSALRSGLLLENGVLSHFAFNNIVAIALQVDETDWAEQFIHEHSPNLEKKHREATFHLNLARVEYVRRRLREALLHLQQADYKDLINNLIAKTLQLKIYYETGEFDALDAHLQSMQAFIRRQRVIGYHKTNYLNIIKYTRRLARHNPNSRSERAELRQQIEQEAPLTEKEWLLERLQ
jgi:hypothetical protein